MVYRSDNRSPAQLRPAADALVKRYELLHSKLLPAQRKTGIAWRWEREYQTLRYEAEILLDLLGYFPGDRTDAALRQATALEDARLKNFAVVSLLRHHQDVPPEMISSIASNSEMRRSLYKGLLKLHKEALFPPRFLTKEAMAESDMVGWLTFATELDREPDEIQLMKVVPQTDAEGQVTDLYIFRFRTLGDHWAAKRGWMQGEAGPYPRDKPAGCEGLGGTFSTFDAWDDAAPDGKKPKAADKSPQP